MEWPYRTKRDWERWFAWYPVKLEHEDVIVWLKMIKRKRDILWYYRRIWSAK